MDNEVKGGRNELDYGARVYDPRAGRFLSVDPLTKGFPQLTPYQFASNSPIANIDLDGEESKYYNVYFDQLYNAKGKLIFSTSHQVENKSKEKGAFTNALSYTLTGNSKTGTMFVLSSTVARIDENGNLTKDKAYLGQIYIPGKDDKTRGGLYLVSKDNGSYTSEPGDLTGKDTEPISIDLLLGAAGISTGGGEIEEIANLRKALANPKLAEKILKVAETAKTVVEANETGGKIGEAINVVREKLEDMKSENEKQAEEKVDRMFTTPEHVIYRRDGGPKTKVLDTLGNARVADENEKATDTFPRKR